jgi:TonB family protein
MASRLYPSLIEALAPSDLTASPGLPRYGGSRAGVQADDHFFNDHWCPSFTHLNARARAAVSQFIIEEIQLMNSSIAIATLIALCLLRLFLSGQPQSSPERRAVAEMEKQAAAQVQWMLASELDADLPGLPFAGWFQQVIGPGAGVVWQLSECGDDSSDSGEVRACVEANTIIADGRGIIVRVAVGTFKRGMIGAPTFYLCVIEEKGELYQVRRLRDLHKLLWTLGSLATRPAVKLPEINMSRVGLAASNASWVMAPVWSGEGFGRMLVSDESPPAPAPPRAEPALSEAASIAENQGASETPGSTIMSGEVKLLGSMSWGDVIKKAQPRYPAKAKRVNASGPVDVRITISQEGRVVEAKAISGHLLLREAAEEAARQWVFRPAILNGVPVETQRVLTFVFAIPQ